MKDNWDKSFKKISLHTIYILAPLSIIALFLFGWKQALSIVLGGFFAVINFRGVIWGVHNIIELDKGKSKMMFMTFFRLMVLFSILLILLIFDVINIPAIVLGLTIVFILILLEGLARARQIKDEA